jgi:hypothetical protein
LGARCSRNVTVKFEPLRDIALDPLVPLVNSRLRSIFFFFLFAILVERGEHFQDKRGVISLPLLHENMVFASRSGRKMTDSNLTPVRR